jgi:hypothetical protein
MATTILIVCPECNRQVKAPDNVIGKKVRCKFCQAAFVARKGPDKPPPGKPAKSPAGKPDKRPTGKPAKPVLDDEEDDPNPYGVTTLDLTPRCPNCANELENADDIICLHCGYNTQTRMQFKTRKVHDLRFGEHLLWLLPGIACVLVVLGVLGFDIWYLWKIGDVVDQSAWWGEALSHSGIKLWVVIISLFIMYLAGKFAVRRLILHPKPPEVEKLK